MAGKYKYRLTMEIIGSIENDDIDPPLDAEQTIEREMTYLARDIELDYDDMIEQVINSKVEMIGEA